MKRSSKTWLRILLCLVALTCCILAFASCANGPRILTDEELLAMDETKRAATLMEVSYGNLDYVDSFTSISEMNIKISGVTMVSNVTTKMQGWLKGKFSINYNVVNNTTGRSTQSKFQFGHESGKTYIVPENSDNLLWCSQSTKDFLLENSFLDVDVVDNGFIFSAYEGASKASASQKNNKLWRASFTDFSDEWLEKFEGLINDVKPAYESVAELENVTVIIDIDSEMRLEKLDITFKFKSIGSTSSPAVFFNYKLDIHSFDVTKVAKKTFDAENETESFDKIDELIDSMEEIPEKKKGKITINSVVSTKQNGTTKTQSGSVVLNFDNKNNKLSYTMTTQADGQSGNTVTYEDGVYKMNGISLGKTTDSAERAGIAALLNVAELSYFNYEACKITKADTDTVYELTLSNPDISAYSSLARDWDEVDAKLKITVAKDGTVKRYVYTLNLSKQGTTVESKYVVTTSLTNAR